MATDRLGTDISLDGDLTDAFVLVSGRRMLIQAVLHRLQTERGTLIDDENYGLDVRSWVNETMTGPRKFALSTSVEAEVRKDERVAKASASCSFSEGTSKLSLALQIQDSDGDTFDLTVGVSALSVELLSINGEAA